MLFNVFKKIFRSDDPTVRNSDGGFDSMNMRDFEIFVSKNSNLAENLKLLEKDVCNTFSSREDAFKFVCYELDAASYGNETATNFVKNSGVTYTDYNGAMNSYDQKGSDILLELSPKIAPVMSMMANVRIYVVDKIMQKYEIGKYQKCIDKSFDFNKCSTTNKLISLIKKQADENSIFSNIVNDILKSPFNLEKLVKNQNNKDDHIFFMASVYALRFSTCASYLRGLVEREAVFSVQSLWGTCAMITSGEVEFQEKASDYAVEFLQTYNENFTKDFIMALTSIVMNGEELVIVDRDELLIKSIQKTIKQLKVGKYNDSKSSSDDAEIKNIILELRSFVEDKNFMSAFLLSQITGVQEASQAAKVKKFNDLYYQLSSLTGISVDDIEIKDILEDPIKFKRKN